MQVVVAEEPSSGGLSDAVMGERWRLRHDLKYNDDTIIPLRLEARKYQQYLQESRDELNRYLRGHHPDFRAAERDLARFFDEFRELATERQVLEREISSVRHAAGEVSDQMATLTAEYEHLSTQLAERRAESPRLITNHAQIRRQFALQDDHGTDLWRIEQTMQEAFDTAHRTLHKALDEHPAVAGFDQQQRAVANAHHMFLR